MSRDGSGSIKGSLPLMSMEGMVAGDSGIGGRVSSRWWSASVVVIGDGTVVVAVVLGVVVSGVMVVSSIACGVGAVVDALSVKVVVPVHL